ncbi:MAG: cysteine hydrolase [Clostridiales bacterium]|nr:cysteine hydrolase [Candidatus Crickella merdequi]
MKFLVVVDMQNDFVDGCLGTKEAQAISEDIAAMMKEWDGAVLCTYDTHQEDYLDTLEGHYLPVKHCVKDTDGWQLCPAVEAAAAEVGAVRVMKPAFGSVELPQMIGMMCGFGQKPEEIHLVGVCTDICVISNAMMLKAFCRETPVYVHKDLCAGVTPEQHEAALTAMKPCQIEVI